MPSANIAIRLAVEDLESLDGQAEREGRSRSGQARYIIREHLANGRGGNGSISSTGQHADAEPKATA